MTTHNQYSPPRLTRHLRTLLILALVGSLALSSDAVITGFLELDDDSSSDSFDFSSVTVSLLDQNDRVVGQANPADNGFYLIPIEHTGDFKLTVQPSAKSSYSFSPDYQEVKLKGLSSSQVENLLKDESYNFQLDGFTLSDKVYYLGEAQFSSRGAPGIKVELQKDGEVIGSSETNARGFFKFNNVRPGQYTVVTKSSVTQATASQEMTCTFSWEQGKQCQGKLSILGSDAHGQLTIYGEPFSDAYILLSTADGQSVQGCSTEGKVVPELLKGYSFNCFVRLQQNGFTFRSLPHGVYIVTFVDAGKAGLKFGEKALQLIHSLETVERNKTIFDLEASLRVYEGQVQNFGGSPVEGVEIKLEGETKAVSDHRGNFQIKDLAFGTYDFEAVKEHYTFDQVSEIKINARSHSSKVLRPLRAGLASICGTVQFMEESGDSESEQAAQRKNYQVQVILREHDSNQTKGSTKADLEGNYCFQLPKGTYIVEPKITFKSKKFNVLPRERKVVLDQGPVLGVDFSREKLSVKGRVSLIPGMEASTVQNIRVKLSNMNNEDIEVLRYSDLKRGEFQFEDLFDDQYIIRLESDSLCFDKQSFKTSQNSGDLVFKQKGIKVAISSDSALEVTFKGQQGGSQVVPVKAGQNEVCLEFVDTVQAAVDTEVILAEGKNQFEFSPQTTQAIQLAVESIRFETRIEVDFEQLTKIYGENLTGNMLQNKFAIEFSDKHSGRAIDTKKFVQDGAVVFQGYAAPSSQVTAVPSIVDRDMASRLVILQKSMQLNIGRGYNARVQKEPFEVTIGRRLFFKTQKAIPGVSFHISRAKASAKEGSFQKYQTKVMDLEDDLSFTLSGKFNYDIRLEKTGFELSTVRTVADNGDLTFTVGIIEISHLRIYIEDEHKQPRPDIMVYITSMSRERRKMKKITRKTNKQGLVELDLYKGKYYIKPVLKEYEFEPSQKTFVVEEGETYPLNMIAKRTAYSVYGAVRSLGKLENKGLEIEATTDEDDSTIRERAITDYKGKFKVMGLKPGKNYKLKILDQNDRIVIPQQVDIVAQEKDTKDVTFVIAEKWRLKSVVGTIKIADDISADEVQMLTPIKVTIHEMLSQEDIEDKEIVADKRTVALRRMRRFEFANLFIGRNYSVEVRVGASSEPVFSTTIDTVQLSHGLNTLQDIVISRKDLNLAEQQGGGSSFSLLVILGVVGLLVYNNIFSKNN